MDDLISRQAAIDAMYKILHDYFWANDEELDAIIATLNDLPSAQPVVKDTNVPNNDDIISRHAVIDRAVTIPMFGRDVKMVAVSEIKNLPSAQPEIIRCKDCRYWDKNKENGYLPGHHYCVMIEEEHKGDFYCGYAKRRTDG